MAFVALRVGGPSVFVGDAYELLSDALAVFAVADADVAQVGATGHHQNRGQDQQPAEQRSGTFPAGEVIQTYNP